MKLEYKDLSFTESGDYIIVLFLKIYYFNLEKDELNKLGKFKIEKHSISFESDKKTLKQKFDFLLTKGFTELKCTINNKPTLYVHKNSGIPLIGSNEFGIIDRGTNTIEVKPITTCNIDCIFCSVDHTKRERDIVVEQDYLIDELKKVIKLKQNKVNIHIGSQGDPSLYGNLVSLVRKSRKIKQVNAISMVTNGILITKTIFDKLVNAGMTHFHVSLHSLHPYKASELANYKYPVKKVKKVCEYMAKKAHLLLVPVWLPSINDKDIEDIIKFSKGIGAFLGIQNFLEYKFGKRPVNSVPMKLFYKNLKELESKLNVDLTSLDNSLEFKEDTKLIKPFKKGEIITVEIKAKARLRNTVIAVAEDRVVTVVNCFKEKGNVKVKLIRDKHNIFTAVLV